MVGCAFSTDVVHIAWDRCPAAKSNFYSGKEGHPTVAYEVAVSHRKEVFASTPGHPGARNDKTIVRYDAFIQDIRQGRLWNNVSYRLPRPGGSFETLGNVWGLVDGGYHKWKELISTDRLAAGEKEVRFTKAIERIRKDVECVFGIIKRRHWILRNKVNVETQNLVDDIFLSCIMLHNICLKDEGWLERSDDETFWSQVSPDKYIDIEEPEDEPPGGNEVDPTYIGAQNTQGPEVTLVEERDDDYKEFRDKLIDAYDILFKQNQISWLH